MEISVKQSPINGIPVPSQITHEIKATPRKKPLKSGNWWRLRVFVPFSMVSRMHLYEARERYFNLMELIRFHARLSGLYLPDYEKEDFKYPDDIRELEKQISKENTMDETRKNKISTLLCCYENLIDARQLLTRKQGDLNRLWRALTRVRSRINNQNITTPDLQSYQLYFCQEEAFQLGVDNDPRIKTMLQDLAEAIDSKGVDTVPRYTCILHALVERFNTIRTGRILQQFINIRTYWIAFSCLMVISFLLIENHDVILQNGKNPTADTAMKQEQVTSPGEMQKAGDNSISDSPTTPVPKTMAKQKTTLPGQLEKTPYHLPVFLQGVKDYLKQNMLAFIFLGGLTGGFFSVTTRPRSRDFIPGEDAYYTVYILTKPFIGALGAIILFILIQSEFASQEIIKVEMMAKLKEPGPVSFGFALIAGFSERVVFPKFR